MVRGPFFDKNGLKKGAWNAEEDSKLRAYVQRYGHWNWRELPKFAGLSRCGKSCRLRWMNYLRPEVKHGNYTVEEEDLILKLHQKLGNKWSIIAANLPGRTDNEVKNHWHTHLSKREKINSTSEVKEQSTSIEISQCEANQSRECEAESFLANTSSHPILESSSLSPETSSTEFSSMSSDHAPVSSVNREDSLNTWETFEISSGDFWTQPFVADNTHNQDGYPLSLAGGEFISSFVSYYDNDIDLFY